MVSSCRPAAGEWGSKDDEEAKSGDDGQDGSGNGDQSGSDDDDQCSSNNEGATALSEKRTPY